MIRNSPVADRKLNRESTMRVPFPVGLRTSWQKNFLAMLSPILLFAEPGLHRQGLQASNRCFWHLCWLNSDPAGDLILCVSHSGLWDCIISELHCRWSPWREVWTLSQLSPRDIASLASSFSYSSWHCLSSLHSSPLSALHLSLIFLHRWPGH